MEKVGAVSTRRQKPLFQNMIRRFGLLNVRAESALPFSHEEEGESEKTSHPTPGLRHDQRPEANITKTQLGSLAHFLA